MRLHSLRLSAVGPFADEQVVDFDRLGVGGLFLLEGPTGVGKSTILDAVTFALYGGLAGGSGDVARMRSDFADPHTRPEVQVEFSVRGARHRVSRSPEHLRPKRRGDGVTKERSSVHLERLGPTGWTSRSHAKDEVGVLVTELVGLNREQFRQVVLLPQGEFATFLRAGDDERRDVLSRLFGAGFFARVTEALQRRAQEASRALGQADDEVRTCIAAACEAAGLGAEQRADVAAAPLTGATSALATIGAGLREAAARASSGATRAREFVDSVRAEQDRAQDVCERIERRAAVARRLSAIESTRADQEQRRRMLARARSAAPVRPLVVLADQAEARASLLRGRLAARRQGDPETEGHGWQELDRDAAQARDAALELAPVVTLEQAMPGRRSAAHGAHELVEQLAAELAGARVRGDSLPGELGAARAALAQAERSAAGVEAAHAQREILEGRAAGARRARELAEQVRGLREDRRTARRAHEAARDHHELLVEHRMSDLSGQLASRLVAGDPCLVCGSPDHPSPATGPAEAITEEQVRAAAAEQDHARLLLDEAELALVRAEADLAHAEEAAGGTTPEHWAERIAEAAADVAAREAARDGLAELSRRVDALSTEQSALHESVVELTERLATARATAAQAESDLADCEQQVARGRGEFRTVAERVSWLVARAATLTELSAAAQELDRAVVASASALQTAVAEARDAGFPDLAEARAAMLPPAELATLEGQVEQWEADLASTTGQLASAELVEVAGVAPAAAAAALAAAELVLADAEEHAGALQREAALAARQVDRFAVRMAEVEEHAGRRAELHGSCAELMSLDQYARGMAGTPRMSLVTFVLRYWFEQVVAAANVRLDTMSAGKYQLIRVDEGTRRDARVGLGLVVLDRHTGRERSPGTLSGGETFYTSLSLALGLADVVVAQAGGAQLDTLFIDEGFGSLDPDTLDDVMGVIDDLRGNGRVIGVISHVPELKERIPERLEVRRVRPDGPSGVSVLA